MPKQKMGFLDHEGQQLSCLFGDQWPPGEVLAYGSIDLASPYLKEKEIQRLEVWEKVCGLLQMSADKCPSCKYMVRNGTAQMYSKRTRVVSKRLRAPAARPPKKKR